MAPRSSEAAEPMFFGENCRDCPRLDGFLDEVRAEFPAYYSRPIPAFGERAAELLIVGLAPGKHGAYRTGRPFTGDFARILLYETLHEYVFANQNGSDNPLDGFKLTNYRIMNAVMCLPPQNKPDTAEICQCNRFLAEEIKCRPHKVILALGSIAHQAGLMARGMKIRDSLFGHHAVHELPVAYDLRNGMRLYDSYHCSCYCTQTRRLTPAMFEDIFLRARALLDE